MWSLKRTCVFFRLGNAPCDLVYHSSCGFSDCGQPPVIFSHFDFVHTVCFPMYVCMYVPMYVHSS